MEQHIGVFNSKSIAGKLVANSVERTPEIGDVVDLGSKLIFLKDAEAIRPYQNTAKTVLELCIIYKDEVVVDNKLMSASFKKAVAAGKVKIDSLVCVVVKTPDRVDDQGNYVKPVLFINDDNYAFITPHRMKAFSSKGRIPTVIFTENEWLAIKRFQTGERWAVARRNDQIAAGYGVLHDDNTFEHPLPTVYIKQIYNTTSWNEMHRRNLVN